MKSDMEFTDGSNQVWVSGRWLKEQTATQSTAGWTDLVVEKLKAKAGTQFKLANGQVWWKKKDVLRAFKEVGQTSH